MEINPITDADVAVRQNIERIVDWTEPGLHITRFRLLGDVGFPFLDVSYCHGQLRDGTCVRVSLPFSNLPKKRWKSALVEYAKQDRVNAARLGMFDNVSIFI